MDEEIQKILEEGKKKSRAELETQIDKNIEEQDKWAKEQKGYDSYAEWHEAVL